MLMTSRELTSVPNFGQVVISVPNLVLISVKVTEKYTHMLQTFF